MAKNILIPDSVHSDFADFLITLSKDHTLIFDLDNTIYDEKEFLFNSYRNISIYLNEEFGCNEEEVFNFLSLQFHLQGRDQLLDKLEMQVEIPNENFIKRCLEIMRSTIVSPKIKPFNYFLEYRKTTKNSPVYIITNGTPKQQANKIESIDWGKQANFFVVYANEHIPKPAADSFFYLQKNQKLNNPIYIGDSAEDYNFAKNCGIEFIEVFKNTIR